MLLHWVSKQLLILILLALSHWQLCLKRHIIQENYLLILFFQIMFNIFKVLEIKYTFENKINSLMLNSVWINLVSLASVYFSLDSLLKGDMWVLPFYIGGSVLGKWIAMTQMDNLESKLFIFFKTKEDGKRNTRVRPK